MTLKQRRPLSPFLFKVVLQVLATMIRQKREIKGIQIGTEEIKVQFFIVDVLQMV